MPNPQSALSIHICTKDRPQTLKGLIRDLSQILQPDEFLIFVYDDSVKAGNRTKNRRIMEQLAGKGFYIDEPRRIEILSAIPQLTDTAREYAEYAFKTLGNPKWDHAGVISFAQYIAGVCADPDDRVLILDDDIRLTSGKFLDKYYKVDTAAVRYALTSEVPAGTLLGARYVGRADMSLAEHLEQAKLTDNLGKEKIFAYDGKPEKQDFPVLEISGAFMLMRAETVRAVPPAHIFDEDWIFISLARHQGVQLRVADFMPIHDGGDFLRSTVEWARYQQLGHVFFRSLYLALAALGRKSSMAAVHKESIALCRDRAIQETQIWQSLLKPSSLLEKLNWSQSEIDTLLDVNNLTMAAIDALDEYFAAAPGWHDLFKPDCMKSIRQQFGL